MLPQKMQPNKDRQNEIFVSSTFQDMQQERDALQRIVLPKIKDFVKQYGRNIELCDLRWGVNSLDMDEESSAKKVLQVCFDEIDNARPFFIAILGDRYGWIPPENVTNNSLLGRKISVAEMLHKSVTEMEITYGALSSFDSGNVRFYFRKINENKRFLFRKSDLPARFASASGDDRRRMELLKNKIEKQFPGQIRPYSVTWNSERSEFDGMEAFAEMVFQDLKSMIVHEWGEPSLLSDYERQFYQYRYVLACDDLLEHVSEEFAEIRLHPDNARLKNRLMDRQNYILVSEDEFNLNRLFSALAKRYQSNGSFVIPYDCGQSILSSSYENMMAYFMAILSGGYMDAPAKPRAKEEANGSDKIRQFHEFLADVDSKIDASVVLAIRGIHYLDKSDVFAWLPSEKYHNIHFLISLDHVFPMPASLKDMTGVFYFQNAAVFDRNVLIDAYMRQYHKELDTHVREAILKKSEGKDWQYMEFLMQRLLVLSKEDFQVIAARGDGMQKISEYLNELVDRAPELLDDMVHEQIAKAKEETGEQFATAVLSVLLALPYGIARAELEDVLHAGHVDFSLIDLALLRRRLSMIMIETLDGYYRLANTPATEVLRCSLEKETDVWGRRILEYLNGFDRGDMPGGQSLFELFRSQYLGCAARFGQEKALSKYLCDTDYDVEYFALVFGHLPDLEKTGAWLENNASAFSAKETDWMVSDFYHYLSNQKLLENPAFGGNLLKILKTLIQKLRAELAISKDEQSYHRYFLALYDAGEIAWLGHMDGAEGYLLEAKKVSKENFRLHPNRIWKMLNGIELTEEEKTLGYGAFEDLGETVPEGTMFGFSGELEDCELEQSWSASVRIIDNYLASIYREKGDVGAAKQLETESDSITHMADPDPLHKGQNQINPYISIIWPHEPEDGAQPQKRMYKPDYRRNSAIKISKEAGALLRDGKKNAALEKYQEANGILSEIYEDGETGEYYDLTNVVDDPDVVRISIQKECARDLGINYRMMLNCQEILDTNEALKEYIREMISYALIYDEFRNNLQSKRDLEEYYLVSARIYFTFAKPSVYYERILDDIDHYFTYRMEAHLNGEQTDDNIMNERRMADQIVYDMATENPQVGPWLVDCLLKHSNNSVKANDFNGFLDLTNLMRNLLQWMWANSCEWRGSRCSLEDIYFTNVENQCMLWEQNQMSDRLKDDVDMIVKLLPNVRDAGNVLRAAQCISRWQMVLLRSGKYRGAAEYGEVCLNAFLGKKDEIPLSSVVITHDKLVAAYSESGQYEKAHKTALDEERMLQYMQSHPMNRNESVIGMTDDKYRDFIIRKKMSLFFNHAIVYIRMGKRAEGRKCLEQVRDWLAQYPAIAASEAGLAQRVEYFLKNGL